MEKEFTIVSFAWDKESSEKHRSAGVVYATDEFILERLRSLAGFFESRSLTTRKLLDSNGEVHKDFVLKSNDLTAIGLAVLRKGYKGWEANALKRPPGDVSAMESAFKKIMEGKKTKDKG